MFEKSHEPNSEIFFEEKEDKHYSIDGYLNFKHVSYLIIDDAVEYGCVIDFEEQLYTNNNDTIKFSRKPKMNDVVAQGVRVLGRKL